MVLVVSVFQKLMTDFGLVASWNTKASIVVYVPHTYWNSTCGLCGTLDGDKNNDFQTPEGTMVSLTANDIQYVTSKLTEETLLSLGVMPQHPLS